VPQPQHQRVPRRRRHLFHPRRSHLLRCQHHRQTRGRTLFFFYMLFYIYADYSEIVSEMVKLKLGLEMVDVGRL